MRAVTFSVALALASLAGCADREEPLTISASVVGREGEILERQLRRFESGNPGLRVSIRRTPDDATQRHQLYVQWLNARLGDPDIVQLDVVWTAELAAAGWIEPAPPAAAEQDEFFPATVAANRWRGRVWAVPWFVDVGMLYRRTDLIPRAPASLEELAREAAAARSAATPMGFVWQGARYEGLVTVFLEILTAHGGEILDARGRPALRSAEALAALEYLRSLIASEISPAEVLTWHEEETRFAFQNGRAALMRNWPYAVPLLAGENDSAVAGRFAISPMPAARGGTPSATLGGAQLAVSAWSDRKADAWRLVAFLTAPEQMIERALATGQYPPRMALYDSPELARALGTDPAEVRRIIEAATPRPVTPVYSELSAILQAEIHGALAGTATPQQALARADVAIGALLDRAGLGEAPR